MKNSHDAGKHLGRHTLVDWGIAFKVERRSLSKNVIRKPHDFILITLALEEALFCAVVETFFHAA